MDYSEYVEVADSRTRTIALFHSVGMVLAAFAVGIALGLASLYVLAAFTTIRGGGGELTPTASAVSSVFQFVGFILAVLGYLLLREDWSLVRIRSPSLRDLGLVVGGFVGIIVLNTVSSALISAIGLQSAQNGVVEMGQQHPEYFLYMIPITLFLVGPGEELVFRGVVQGWFRRAYGPALGIVFSSLLFGAAHYFALVGTGGEGKFVYMAVAAVLGLVLGTIYEVSENIAVPILAHGIWNAFLFIVQWYVATHDIALLLHWP
ncbi:MAG: lysostaphin resistance A-like protein [Halapricum sp.]